jgi:transcriptional accessory protein Tex/SPT6
MLILFVVQFEDLYNKQINNLELSVLQVPYSIERKWNFKQFVDVDVESDGVIRNQQQLIDLFDHILILINMNSIGFVLINE